MDSDIDIGRRIVALRELRTMNQTTLADEISTAKNTLSEYESGIRHLPLEKAKRICRRLGCSLDWLIEGIVGERGHDVASKLGPRPRISQDDKPGKKAPPRRKEAKAANR